MSILAGTSRGLYRIEASSATQVLDKPLVLELKEIEKTKKEKKKKGEQKDRL